MSITARPLNYSYLCLLFMTAFSHATGKFARAAVGWQEPSCQSISQRQDGFHPPHRQGRLWDAHSADKPYHLYIASIVWRAAIFFFQYAKHLPCYCGKFRPDLHVIKTIRNMFYKRLLEGLFYLDNSCFIFLQSTF